MHTDTVQQGCPEGYKCGLAMKKSMHHVEGYHDYTECNPGAENHHDFYSFDAPRVAGGSPIVEFGACIAHDSPNQGFTQDITVLCAI